MVQETLVAGEPMTTEEMKEASARVEGKKSPFTKNPVKPAKISGTLKRIDGSEIKQVGSFIGAPEVGDSQTLKKFKRIMPNFNKIVTLTRGNGDDAIQIQAKWVPMSIQESLEYQGVIGGKITKESALEKGVLLGYDSDHKMGLLEIGSIKEEI